MRTKELGQYGIYVGAALLLAATNLAHAGTAPAAAAVDQAPSVLSQALNDIRAEQRQAVRQAALKALAGLRSETLAALSKGSTVAASTSVQAKP